MHEKLSFYDVEHDNQMGVVHALAHFLIIGTGLSGIGIYEMVRVGTAQLLGEVIRIDGDKIIIVLFDDTSFVGIGDAIMRMKKPLSVELGPGMLGQIFDALQRPFKDMTNGGANIYVPRGLNMPRLDRQKLWEFIPQNFKLGDYIVGGDVFGKVYETLIVTHWIMLPPKAKGTIVYLAPTGHYTVTETMLTIEYMGSQESFTMIHEWPMRTPRPCAEKVPVDTPLYTGQRVLDSLFPIGLGGTCAVPGGFGTGKGVMCQNIAKYSNSDIVVYVSCGERGNDLAEILMSFPEITTKVRGNLHSIMKRTIIVGNTSDMPVAAREAAVYTGVTIAEYFRDQGYNATLIVDSTSRWMEVQSIISSRIACDMPSSSGYPAYMAARLACFYERAGKVLCNGTPGRNGSLSIVASVSPPGFDFGDPVTSTTLSICRTFWGLDRKLAQRRHFPAVNCGISFSHYAHLSSFLEQFDAEYSFFLAKMKEILQHDVDLYEIVQLVGTDSLQESDKLNVKMAELIREDFLCQDVMTEYDRECPYYKTVWMMKNMITYYELAMTIVEDAHVTVHKLIIASRNLWQLLVGMKYLDPSEGRMVVEKRMKSIHVKILNYFCISNNM